MVSTLYTCADRSERRRKQKKTKIKVLLVDMKVTAIVVK